MRRRENTIERQKISKNTKERKLLIVSRQNGAQLRTEEKERKKERKGKSERDNANNNNIDHTVPSSSFV